MRLSNWLILSEASGDAKSYEADDFEQFSDTHRSTSDDYVYVPDEDYAYTPDEEYTDEGGTAANSDDEEPEFSYQNTTMGPLETNHGAIASAVPGTGAAASSVSAGAGMSPVWAYKYRPLLVLQKIRRK